MTAQSRSMTAMAVTVLALASGCTAAGAAHPVPAASVAGLTAPGNTAVQAASPSTDPGQGVGAPAATGPDPGNAPPVVGVIESTVWVPAGDHRVPGTLALAAEPLAGPLPVVLLLHGDQSSRNENGQLFTRLSADLAGHGIASLRVDFAGSGDSEQPDLALDYPGMVLDATAALNYLQADPRLDPNRVAVLGLSRGGAIAATLAGTVPGVAALAEWSGAVYNGYDEDPAAHDQARVDGYVTVDGNAGPVRLSLNWYDSVEQSQPLNDVAGYTGPVLAVTGSADDVVPPDVSDVFVQTVASTDTTQYTVDGADHEFDATTDDQSHAEEALAVTTDWLASKLAAAAPP
jgi:dipeptidyl aminopeptidase/acylaminoacyl peptidase